MNPLEFAPIQLRYLLLISNPHASRWPLTLGHRDQAWLIDRTNLTAHARQRQVMAFDDRTYQKALFGEFGHWCPPLPQRQTSVPELKHQMATGSLCVFFKILPRGRRRQAVVRQLQEMRGVGQIRLTRDSRETMLHIGSSGILPRERRPRTGVSQTISLLRRPPNPAIRHWL